jgi:hypothetical protein
VQVVDVLNTSLASWADATHGPVQFVMKGQNILTEMYVLLKGLQAEHLYNIQCSEIYVH